MEEVMKAHVENCAEHGFDIILKNNLPTIIMPTIKSLKNNLFTYLNLFGNYITKYKAKYEDLYFDITKDSNSQMDFALFINFFINSEGLEYKNSTFKYADDKYINIENFTLFMDTILILHHRYADDKSDYKPINDLARRMIEEAERRRRKIEEKIQESQTNTKGSGWRDIVSTVSARHPSINLLNINELNYFQIIDQYKRLLMIDKYTPCLNGNATSEYIEKNNVTHYGSHMQDKK